MKKEREMREWKKILKVKAKEKQRLLFFFKKIQFRFLYYHLPDNSGGWLELGVDSRRPVNSALTRRAALKTLRRPWLETDDGASSRLFTDV